MQLDKLITLVLLILILVAMYLVLSYTKVSPLTFAYGALICIIIQAILLVIYFAYKIQKVYRQASSISLKPNQELDPQRDYKFVKIQAKEDFFFNSYTDQAKYFDHRNKIKALEPANKDDFYFEEIQLAQPKKNIMDFLKQIEGYYISLNIFTDVLINFGRNLRFIQKNSIFQKNIYHFTKFQEFYYPQYPSSQMKKSQNDILEAVKAVPQKSKDKKKVLLPSWQKLLQSVKYIGSQFQKIEPMRRSNSQMFEMIHKKVLQDFSLLQKRLIQVGKQLNQILKNLKDMRQDYTKYQNLQINNANDTNQIHLQMMQWVKRRYYESRDLEKRIKENQIALKERTAIREHLQKKLGQFRNVSKKAYIKTVKTRYIALLDSYHITVEQSIKIFQECLKKDETQKQPQIPFVKQIQPYKNVNEALQAQKKYQNEYFDRVDYFLKIGSGMIKSMDSLGEFIANLQEVFSQMKVNLKSSENLKQKMAKYFTQLTLALLSRSTQIGDQLSHLYSINQKFISENKILIEHVLSQIQAQKKATRSLLLEIDPHEGPVRHKFKSAKYQMQKIYIQIEQKINKIQQFQSLYLLHSGRIKKIVIIKLVDFLNYQRKFIAFGNIRVDFKIGLMEEYIGFDKPGAITIGDGQPQGDRLDFENNLLTEKPDLSPIYIKFLNQFLFVCFTQWKTSNYFKHEILQQLFIAFNKDPNESFSKIQVSQMQFSGLPPQVIWVKILKSDQKQAFFDVNLAFKGKIKFKVNTIYKLFRDIPVEVTIQIEEFYCVIRFCFVPSDVGQGWFSFLGQPISKFKIVPSIANYRFDIQTLRTMFNNFLTGKLKKRTYPIKQKISVPASKKDEDLAIIQKRFKAIQEVDAYR